MLGIRISLLALILCTILTFFTRLFRFGFKSWRIEQTFSVLFLMITEFYTISEFFARILYEIKLLVDLCIILKYVYDIIFLLFITTSINAILLNNTRYLKISNLIACFYYALLISLGVFDTINNRSSIVYSYLLYFGVVFVILSIFVTFFRLDPTDSQRFRFYSFIFIEFIFLLVVVPHLSDLKIHNTETISYLIRLTTTNAIPIINAFYHLPYEYSIDSKYHVPDDKIYNDIRLIDDVEEKKDDQEDKKEETNENV